MDLSATPNQIHRRLLDTTACNSNINGCSVVGKPLLGQYGKDLCLDLRGAARLGEYSGDKKNT